MRSTFEYAPARRPLPRQMDASDWVSSSASDISSGATEGRGVQTRDRDSASATTLSSSGGFGICANAAHRSSTRYDPEADDSSSQYSRRAARYMEARSFDRLATDARSPPTVPKGYPRLPYRHDGREGSASMDRNQDTHLTFGLNAQPCDSVRNMQRARLDGGATGRPSIHDDKSNQLEFRDRQRSSSRDGKTADYSTGRDLSSGAHSSRGGAFNSLRAADGLRSSDHPQRDFYETETHHTLYQEGNVGSSRYPSAASLQLSESDHDSRHLPTLPASPPSTRSPRSNDGSSVSATSPARELSNQSDNDTEDSSMHSRLSLSSHTARSQSLRSRKLTDTAAVASSRHKSPGKQRAELYAFRKDMREVLSRVDEMADAHRDLFRTDPASGVPVLNITAHKEVELLTEQVFEELASLRARFHRIAMDLNDDTPPIPLSDVNRSYSIQDAQRFAIDDAVSNQTGEGGEESEHTHDGARATGSAACALGTRRIACEEDESMSVSDAATATTLEKTGGDSCDSLSRRLSVSLESDSASSAASPPSQTFTLAESVGSSEEASPPRRNAFDSLPVHAAVTEIGRDDRRHEVDGGGTNIFQDFDRRMEEIRSSLSAIARGRQGARRVRPAASSSPSTLDPSRADRHQQLQHLLGELRSEGSP